MCGIAGMYRLDGSPLPPEASAQVQAMCESMAHRGPDGWGVWQDGPVCLGHRRLSIIDLSGGSQPMHSQDNRLHVTFNGEIYNYATLRRELEQQGARFATSSDTESILCGYGHWGTDCLDHFEGMFSFALWDAREQRLFLARDRFGKKPLFHTVQDGVLYFASELSALRQIPGLSFTLSHDAVMRYLAYGYVPTPQTLYAEVHSLPPSHCALWQNGSSRVERYWDLPCPDEGEKRDERELMSELRALLAQAVRRRMVSDVPLGVFLSGGIDSSIVTGIMARQSTVPIKTFSIGFREASYDESRYAAIVARAFGTNHHVQILEASECADILPDVISRLDVPLADASVAPTWLLSRLTRQHVTVALGGDGADELWAGYENYYAFSIAEHFNRWPGVIRLPVERLTRLLPSSAGYVNLRLATDIFLRGAHTRPEFRLQSLLAPFAAAAQRDILDPGFAESALLDDAVLFASTGGHYDHWQPRSAASPLARIFHVYARQFLLDDILVKVDRCSMLHSLEVRAPFLDRAVAEFTARLPVRHKLRGVKGKYLLKKAVDDLLPHEILHRGKRGFQIPVAEWLRTRLRPLVEDMLGEEHLRQQGIFNPAAVRQLVDSHCSGKADLRQPLWTLLVLQLWLAANK